MSSPLGAASPGIVCPTSGVHGFNFAPRRCVTAEGEGEASGFTGIHSVPAQTYCIIYIINHKYIIYIYVYPVYTILQGAYCNLM